MSQSATLYQIDQQTFTELSDDPSKFNIRKAKAHVTFEQNFDGLTFLLVKMHPGSEELIREIFLPGESIGETLDFGDENFEFFDESISSIRYLSPEKIRTINALLDQTDKQQFLNLYSADEFNSSNVYPRVWSHDEARDQAFNKRHLAEGFEDLQKIFSDAAHHQDFILAFVG